MANDKKQKKVLTVSFKGMLKWPKLNEPDYGTDDYPKPDGEFSTRLVGDPSDADVKAMIAKLQPIHDEAVAKAKAEFKELKIETRKKLEKKNGKTGIQINDLFAQVFDKETEEPTGEIEFKFAMKASGEYKKGPKAGKRWNRKPGLFDAKGRPMKNPPEIWSGSIGRVSFEARPYFIPGTGAAGVKLSLEAVRVLDLVSKGERSASAYGFDEEEEGYSYDPSDAAPAEEDDNNKIDLGEGDDAGGDDNPDF